MKIFLDVVGCRLNQSEAERFANYFRALGHHIVPDSSKADLAIINTCAVTVKAAADSRKKIRRAARSGAARIVATGCWATLNPETALSLPGVTEIVNNAEKPNLVARVLGIDPHELDGLSVTREPLPGDRARTRAFIKVQEGCDNHCTYCLTRIARGKSKSRSLGDIGQDICAALKGGAKEVVLTGVQLGAWGRDFEEPQNLADLLGFVLNRNDLERVRLSSIEPWDFAPELLNFWENQRLCKHLHIPLQSASDRILRAMGRPINVDEFRILIEKILSTVPDMAITTDLVAGFPGETQADFEATRHFIQTTPFAGGHVFTYSPRPGTAAFNMPNRVPVPLAKARNKTLREVFHQCGSQYRNGFLGKTRQVLWESGERKSGDGWFLSGLTDNYIRVYAPAEQHLWNVISEVYLREQFQEKNALLGQIVDPPYNSLQKTCS